MSKNLKQKQKESIRQIYSYEIQVEPSPELTLANNIRISENRNICTKVIHECTYKST